MYQDLLESLLQHGLWALPQRPWFGRPAGRPELCSLSVSGGSGAESRCPNRGWHRFGLCIHRSVMPVLFCNLLLFFNSTLCFLQSYLVGVGHSFSSVYRVPFLISPSAQPCEEKGRAIGSRMLQVPTKVDLITTTRPAPMPSTSHGSGHSCCPWKERFWHVTYPESPRSTSRLRRPGMYWA